ncbi:hypothetical protein CcCBS67573_g10448, partial [Chytriomyces confervae]
MTEFVFHAPKWRTSLVSRSQSQPAAAVTNHVTSLVEDADIENASPPAATGRPIGTKQAKKLAAADRDQAIIVAEKLKAKHESIAALHEKNRLLAEYNENKVLSLRLADLDDDAQAI